MKDLECAVEETMTQSHRRLLGRSYTSGTLLWETRQILVGWTEVWRNQGVGVEAIGRCHMSQICHGWSQNEDQNIGGKHREQDYH